MKKSCIFFNKEDAKVLANFTFKNSWIVQKCIEIFTKNTKNPTHLLQKIGFSIPLKMSKTIKVMTPWSKED